MGEGLQTCEARILAPPPGPPGYRRNSPIAPRRAPCCDGHMHRRLIALALVLATAACQQAAPPAPPVVSRPPASPAPATSAREPATVAKAPPALPSLEFPPG